MIATKKASVIILRLVNLEKGMSSTIMNAYMGSNNDSVIGALSFKQITMIEKVKNFSHRY